MNAIILSIGDELILGQTIDTNSAYLARQLAAVGCAVSAHITVGDDQPDIQDAIRSSAAQCDFLIVTGGIGPTADDLTRQALAAVLNVPLELNPSWLRKLNDFFAARNRPMPPLNQIQAMIPKGATMIHNSCGTAAGIHATLSGNCEIFVMPGVPKEMKAMFARDVLPHISQRAGGTVILSKTLHTFGLGESAVAELLGPLMDRSRNPSVGTTVSAGIVSLRINARFDTKQQAQQELDATEQQCRHALADLIYGSDDQSLPQAVADLLKSKIENQKSKIPTVTTAESCTAGLLAKMLTDIPGSSAYFKQGFITYSNEAKQSLLGVPSDLLDQHGAVSEPVAQSMAVAALQRANATYALAISGIAGPDGGTSAKPVGTVCIALASSLPPSSPPSSSPSDSSFIVHRS
ncbi:MAG: competence/damage-inducible protein A, partial [Planctomycetota bacterium]|nr:competence/damage-inducible protein A [Planctomycetota bacterium]